MRDSPHPRRALRRSQRQTRIRRALRWAAAYAQLTPERITSIRRRVDHLVGITIIALSDPMN